MTVETLNNSNEDLISFQEDLANLKNEIDKPWEVKYLKESKDWKYKIYRYMLVKWGTKWWIKKKYIEQIWPWVEWTQFTDKHWKEIEKNNFEKWEVVYLRVPKNEKKENQNDNIDSTPDRTSDEIMKLPKSILNELLDKYTLRKKYKSYHDKIWEYIILNRKKVYIIYMHSGELSKSENFIIENKAFFRMEWADGSHINYVQIIKKVWKEYLWVSKYEDDWQPVYRWKFIRSRDEWWEYFEEKNQ